MAFKEPLFKIIFLQRDTVYEIYARQVSESDMYGFIVVEEIVFDERESLLINPEQEKLKSEFTSVTRTYIPMPAILRIDEVERDSLIKAVENVSNTSNVSIFPTKTSRQVRDE
ncbi:MAG: DUF1820 family protein [Legionellales bacterium]|nr:DUF1820 family protein [Legionellales bacterium]